MEDSGAADDGELVDAQQQVQQTPAINSVDATGQQALKRARLER
jgi:hypothetical protein